MPASFIVYHLRICRKNQKDVQPYSWLQVFLKKPVYLHSMSGFQKWSITIGTDTLQKTYCVRGFYVFIDKRNMVVGRNSTSFIYGYS